MTRQAALTDLTDGGFDAPTPSTEGHDDHATRSMQTSGKWYPDDRGVEWCSDCNVVAGREAL